MINVESGRWKSWLIAGRLTKSVLIIGNKKRLLHLHKVNFVMAYKMTDITFHSMDLIIISNHLLFTTVFTTRFDKTEDFHTKTKCK